LDSNALLAPFQFGGRGLAEIARLFTELSKNDRLVVAEWSWREFASHRTDSLLNAHQSLHMRLSKVASPEGLRCPLLEGCQEYDDIQSVIRDINVATEKYKGLLHTLKSIIRDWTWDDRVSQLYRQVFSTRNTISCPLTDEAILEDVKRRNSKGIPPGFKDKAKPTNRAGDVIIWHSMIGLAKLRNVHVIFVSNEEKHDWVCNSDKHVIAARPELHYEFFQATGQHFGILNWLGFLELMAKDEDAVKQAERLGVDVSLDYKAVQQRINATLAALASITRDLLNGVYSGNDFEFIHDARLTRLIQQFYSLRAHYDKLIHSPTGSHYLGEMEIILEEIEALNGRLAYIQARMKGDCGDDELKLKAECKRFLAIYDGYCEWDLVQNS
jgi:hypothetical protein